MLIKLIHRSRHVRLPWSYVALGGFTNSARLSKLLGLVCLRVLDVKGKVHTLMLSAMLNDSEGRDPGLDWMSLADMTLMKLDLNLSILLDDCLAMLTWGLRSLLSNLGIKLLQRASRRIVKGLLLQFLIKHRDMSGSHRPILNDLVQLPHPLNHAFRRQPCQLGGSWPCWTILLYFKVLLDSECVIDISVVRNHVLERSCASYVLSSRSYIDIL